MNYEFELLLTICKLLINSSFFIPICYYESAVNFFARNDKIIYVLSEKSTVIFRFSFILNRKLDFILSLLNFVCILYFSYM